RLRLAPVPPALQPRPAPKPCPSGNERRADSQRNHQRPGSLARGLFGRGHGVSVSAEKNRLLGQGAGARPAAAVLLVVFAHQAPAGLMARVFLQDAEQPAETFLVVSDLQQRASNAVAQLLVSAPGFVILRRAELDDFLDLEIHEIAQLVVL